MAAADETVEASVVYGLPDEQLVLNTRVQWGSTVKEVILASGVLGRYPELTLNSCIVGIFGERVELDTAVADGDRIELYRPLVADPKESRRRRVAKRTGR